METNEIEISTTITLLENDYKKHKTFISLNQIANKANVELMEQHPDIFYFASKSRVILVRWICEVIRRMYETFSFQDIHMDAEGYDEIRTTLNTRTLNRDSLMALFDKKSVLSYTEFLPYEEKYYAAYNKYAASKKKPGQKKRSSKDILCIEFNNILCTKRDLLVMKSRAKGETLDEVGAVLKVTRERARQIEAKPRYKIRKWMELKSAELKEKITENGAVDEDKALNLFGQDNWEIIKYTIIADVQPQYHWKYIKSINKIIYDETLSFETTSEQILKQAKENHSTVETFIEKMHEAGYPFISYTEACTYLHSKNFNTRGNSICAGKMTIGKAAVIIAGRYFPDGVHTTDPQDMQKFSDLLNQEYQMNTKPDRALQTRIQDVLTMCGRATYCVPSKISIKPQTLKNILNFIQAQKYQDRIPYLTLFAKYEKSLKRDGILNQYALHGILKRYEETQPIICLKHYVCKKDVTSLLSKKYFMAFAEWLQKQNRPVTIEEIQDEFHGWNISTVKCASSYYEEIVQWDNQKYLNLRTIIPDDAEKQLLENLMKQNTDNEYHYTSSYVMFHAIQKKLPEYLEKYQIQNEKQMYYVLQYLFSSNYVFRRPHITSDIKKTTFTTEELVKMVLGNKRVINKQEVSNQLILFYGNKNSSLSLALQKYLRNFIRIGTYLYVRKSCFDISEEQKDKISDFIRSHMTAGKILLPNQIEDFSELPKIACEWNPWVLCEMVDLLHLDFKKIEKRNTPSQNSMAIIMDPSLDLQDKDDVFRWLITHDFDVNRDKSEFQYAKATGMYHTNLTSDEVAQKLQVS